MLLNTATTKLGAEHAALVQSCFDSQPKVMLEKKKVGREPYSETFLNLVESGCTSYGVFNNDVLQAFCIVWPWPSIPASTMVMACNRPDGKIYNPQRSGFSTTLEACLLEMERGDRRITYYVRSSGRAWKNSTAQKGHGRFGEYQCTAAEHIKQGQMSKYSDFNRYILGSRPVSADAVVVAAIAPMDRDF